MKTRLENIDNMFSSYFLDILFEEKKYSDYKEWLCCYLEKFIEDHKYSSFEDVEWFTIEEMGDVGGEGRNLSLDLMIRLDLMRNISGQSIIISSGFSKGGHSNKSMHYVGKAADIYFRHNHLDEMFRLAYLLRFGGIGVYPYGGRQSSKPFMHVDVRPIKNNGMPALWMRDEQFNYVGLPERFMELI